MNRKFHRDVWFPGRIKRQLEQLKGRRQLQYSQHASRASRDDRYGRIPLPEILDVGKIEWFEIEEDKKRIVKLVGRMPIDQKRDIVMACIPQSGGCMFVKTVWINLNDDPHKTLRKDMYEQKPRS